MCGRFGLTRAPVSLARCLEASFDAVDAFRPRFNIAPTQMVSAIVNDDDRGVRDLRWGLVPSWAESPKAMKLTTFNARVETIATAPSYRAALRSQRCAIFATGYFEWRKERDGSKTPLWIYRDDQEPFVFAGLWETWRSRSGDDSTMQSCTIVTQPPNAFSERIHSRMPVVLSEEAAKAWLEPGKRDPGRLLELLVPTDGAAWRAHPVDRRVGNARFDDPHLIERSAGTSTFDTSFDVEKPEGVVSHSECNR